MSANIREILIGFGKGKQTDITTANLVANIWQLKKLNAALANPKLNTESDAEEFGKGHEFATQVFKTSWDITGTIEKYLSSDPLEFAHRYTDPWDQEAVALVSALLAYGNVKQIRRSVEELLARMQEPAAFIRSLETAAGRKRSQAALKGFVHRFNRGEDLHQLLLLLSRSWREHGSLGAHFVGHLRPDDTNIAGALDALIADWHRWRGKAAKGSARP